MFRHQFGRIAFVTFLAMPSVGWSSNPTSAAPKIRRASCAGTWYPKDAAVLTKTVDELLANAAAAHVSGKPLALISPHAGYRFSAPVAAATYHLAKDHDYNRVIVLAFSHAHAGGYEGVDVPSDLTAYETPLGVVPIDREACDRLLADAPFAAHANIDRGEHSLELQLPFLQRVLDDFKLVPLLVGRMSPDAYERAARALIPLLGDRTLLVASSDFTHYGPRYGFTPFDDDVPERIRELAEQSARAICRCDFDGFMQHLSTSHDTICGRGPVALLLRVLSMQGGAKGIRTAYDTSGQITGDWRNSVTYQSFVFVEQSGRLDRSGRAALLKLAREAVEAFLKGTPLEEVAPVGLSDAARSDGACFVTLENHGQLRGCIGNMVANGPLYKAVIRNAVSACQDRRFAQNPVTTAELDQLDIEISHLTPMQLVERTEEIVVGRHGLMITLGPRRGVLLPQVAVRFGWTRDEFLAHTCRKAGLPLDAWKRPDVRIYSFEAEVFNESELNKPDTPAHR